MHQLSIQIAMQFEWVDALERVQFNRKRKKLPLPSVERVFRYAMNSIELNTL